MIEEEEEFEENMYKPSLSKFATVLFTNISRSPPARVAFCYSALAGAREIQIWRESESEVVNNYISNWEFIFFRW